MSTLREAIICYPPIIENVALAIADDAYPNLSRMHYHGLLDEMSGPLFEPMQLLPTLDRKIEAMRAHLVDELGFVGNQDDYYDPRNSFINEVIERRVGIPITLAVVWMAIGRRIGLPVEGISFPGHFLVRIGGKEGRHIDVYNGGRTLGDEDLEKLGERFNLPAGGVAMALEVPSARDIAERMLFNLRGIYAKRGDHARSMLMCDRLFDITAQVIHRRDRGLHALRLGAREAATRDFEAYLTEYPDAEDARRIQALLKGLVLASRSLN